MNPPSNPSTKNPLHENDTSFLPPSSAGNVGSGANPPSLHLGEPGNEMLGEFRLLRRLGRGGMSEVFLAEQTSLKRNVAIKVLRPELMLDPTYRDRFRKEYLAVAKLNHPNIVQVYTVGEELGRVFIAQEYVQGQNLREFINRKGPPEFSVAVFIMKQVAAALNAAGEAGIIHRDIKPENILLTKKGEAKVADFGLAKRSQTSDSQQVTQIGTTMGTPLYMSPEQINGTAIDHRSDIYSFGVTCYHMLSGEPPFRGETAISIAMQHLRQDPIPLEAVRPDLPPLLCRIIQKLMAKDPAQRYQTAAACLKDLKRLGQEENHGKQAHPTQEAATTIRTPALSWKGSRIQTMGWNLWLMTDWPWRKQLFRVGLAGFVLFVGFGVLGAITRPGDPMKAKPNPNATPQANIPLGATAAEQYHSAAMRPSDAAGWNLVLERFPNDSLYTPSALVELGLLELDRNRLDAARTVFGRLVAYGDLEPMWKAAGVAGTAIILNRQHDYAGSQREIERNWEILEKMPLRLRDRLVQTLKSNSEQLKIEVNPRIRQWLQAPRFEGETGGQWPPQLPPTNRPK